MKRHISRFSTDHVNSDVESCMGPTGICKVYTPVINMDIHVVWPTKNCCLGISDPPMVTLLLSQAPPIGKSEFNIKDFTQIIIPSVTGSILFQDQS